MMYLAQLLLQVRDELSLLGQQACPQGLVCLRILQRSGRLQFLQRSATSTDVSRVL